MKINFDTEKIVAYLRSKQEYLPVITVCIVVFAFAVLTYLSLYPRRDSDHVAEGEARVQSLDIRFNTKLLSELGATKTPAQLGTAGGRDPFSGF